MVTAEQIRAYALLPADAADSTVREHLAGAERDVASLTGRTEAPVGLEAVWDEAVMVTAQRRLWPVLYPLDDGYAARDRAWRARAERLVDQLRAPSATENPMMEAL